MPVKTYNKLVRDRIPDIIAANGKACRTRQADGAEYRRLLEKKCAEEWQEYLESGSLEEMADLMEALRALIAEQGWTEAQLEAARLAKRKARGGFESRIVLLDVTEPD